MKMAVAFVKCLQQHSVPISFLSNFPGEYIAIIKPGRPCFPKKRDIAGQRAEVSWKLSTPLRGRLQYLCAAMHCSIPSSWSTVLSTTDQLLVSLLIFQSLIYIPAFLLSPYTSKQHLWLAPCPYYHGSPPVVRECCTVACHGNTL